MLPWHVPLKCWYLSIILHIATFQKLRIYIVGSVLHRLSLEIVPGALEYILWSRVFYSIWWRMIFLFMVLQSNMGLGHLIDERFLDYMPSRNRLNE